MAPQWPTLPEPRNPKVGHALMCWAAAVALVPDASWDQVQALREALPEIHSVLPEPCHVQLLLDFVAQRPGEDPEREIRIL